eukprot:GHVQ01039681.1.p1 GENE.GHVQ01039681.1~~GHVQ01039681.1.p1  ORF type:complete len:637 (-),score=125.79 GHVQ01039681.1:405-2315(-)
MNLPLLLREGFYLSLPYYTRQNNHMQLCKHIRQNHHIQLCKHLQRCAATKSTHITTPLCECLHKHTASNIPLSILHAQTHTDLQTQTHNHLPTQPQTHTNITHTNYNIRGGLTTPLLPLHTYDSNNNNNKLPMILDKSKFLLNRHSINYLHTSTVLRYYERGDDGSKKLLKHDKSHGPPSVFKFFKHLTHQGGVRSEQGGERKGVRDRGRGGRGGGGGGGGGGEAGEGVRAFTVCEVLVDIAGRFFWKPRWNEIDGSRQTMDVLKLCDRSVDGYRVGLYMMNTLYNFGRPFTHYYFTTSLLAFAVVQQQWVEAHMLIKLYRKWLVHPPHIAMVSAVMDHFAAVGDTRAVRLMTASVRENWQMKLSGGLYVTAVRTMLRLKDNALEEAMLVYNDSQRMCVHLPVTAHLDLLEAVCSRWQYCLIDDKVVSAQCTNATQVEKCTATDENQQLMLKGRSAQIERCMDMAVSIKSRLLSEVYVLRSPSALLCLSWMHRLYYQHTHTHTHTHNQLPTPPSTDTASTHCVNNSKHRVTVSSVAAAAGGDGNPPLNMSVHDDLCLGPQWILYGSELGNLLKNSMLWHQLFIYACKCRSATGNNAHRSSSWNRLPGGLIENIVTGRDGGDEHCAQALRCLQIAFK